MDNSLSPIAHLAELWRYPVKSMRGERLSSLEVLAEGIAGDRRFAIRSSGAPVGKPLLTGRERAGMLLYTARGEGGGITVESPDGTLLGLTDPSFLPSLEAALAQGHRLSLVQAQAPLTDCRPMSLLSRETVDLLAREMGRSIDLRRFRPNLVLTFSEPTSAAPATFPEDALVGKTLRIGEAILRVTERDPRCRVVTLDPNTTELDPALMKHLDRAHNGRLGVYAATVRPGRVTVGDAVHLVPVPVAQA